MRQQSAAKELGHALNRKTRDAAEARWLTIGTVVAVAGNLLTVTVDGADVSDVTRTGSYAAPIAGDTVLVGIVRSTRSVQYIAIDKIIG